MVLVYTAGAINTPEFGFVIIVALLAVLQHSIWFTIQVGRARRRFSVLPPILYATPGPTVGGDEALVGQLTPEQCEEYNRYQRVHQNNLEVLPTFFVMLLIAGIGFPIPAGIAGLIWILGRGVYALGYYYSASKRHIGGFYHLGELVLLILCFIFACFLWAKKQP